MSFIGNSKCLSEEDSRSWAQELLQSVGRSTDLISTIMGNKPGSSSDNSRRSSITNDTDIDFDTWRSVLVHMRANYPIGMVSKSAHVQFSDKSDDNQTGILKRIETMKSDLTEIIHFKEEKINLSKSGKIIENSLTLKDANYKVNTENSIQNDLLFNLYADNIFNQQNKSKEINEKRGTITEEIDEDEIYDNIQLTRDNLTEKSHILSLQQSLIDTLSTSGKSIEYDDGFVIQNDNNGNEKKDDKK